MTSLTNKEFEKLPFKLPNSFTYRWEDGWCAHIEAKLVETKEKTAILRKSRGFAGYDWMVDSILSKGIIEVPER